MATSNEQSAAHTTPTKRLGHIECARKNTFPSKRFVAGLGIAAALALGALGLLVVSDGTFWLGSHGADGTTMRSAGLEGSVETTDSNGVVHGTTPTGINYVVYGRNVAGADAGRITFAALGDVIATDDNFAYLDACAGTEGDGRYSFDAYYQEVGPVVSHYDVSFINQETVMAGPESGWDYMGYPSFNTPATTLDAMENAGLDVVNFGSNHTWDIGEVGIIESHKAFKQHPALMMVGSYESPDDRSTVRLIERNGATIAFLDYIYGDNAYPTLQDFPNTYYSCPFDKKAMETEIRRAQQVADAVVVYMHWGTEYTAEPDEVQLDYAQFLANLDVDLVIGGHAHILQPTRYYTSASGKRVPVVFGLSDFISGWYKTDAILSQMFTCDFVWRDDRLVVENLLCYPLIEWQGEGSLYVRFLKDMKPEDHAANKRTADVEDDLAFIRSFMDSLDMEIPVIM